ncbi:hypothetical protein PYH37_002161 [Sinorhizobium numidicum]|uniref:Uncharacterized protein n=1 Tax=Sinorhizobium numidicum TaxID=680248 RepID=A0ABY8CPX0_9HYPH|nr:hypothetical protein [Sinorhizobium numidicum]WEX74693.1 hypothetical protein PYH37_002161 [Sinorhizobium numidicum]WEX80685.1 hypothetical protein PYH38_002163 [Sinorhizobium numidicum]
MPPLVDLLIDRDGMFALWALRDDDPRAAFLHLFDDPVGVESLVGEGGPEIEAVDKWRDSDRVVALARQEMKAHEVAQRIG